MTRRPRPVRVLGLVPARGGSKGVPRKNVRPLAGRPLLEYTAAAVRAANRLARCILSTDDEETAELGRRAGLDVPFMRPAELAGDEVPMLDVVQHALRWLEEEERDRYDAVCLLQPTSPVREAGLIDRCIEQLETSGCDSVMTMREVPSEYNPHWVYEEDAAGDLRIVTGERVPISRRQALPVALHRDGAVYVTRRDVVVDHHSMYGERVRALRLDGPTINIDTMDDWHEAERYFGAEV